MAVHTAKTITVDAANNYGFYRMCVRSIDFYLEGQLVPITADDIEWAHSSAAGTKAYLYSPANAFITALPKTGDRDSTNEFMSESYDYDVRFFCVFKSQIKFDTIVVNNSHSSGTSTTFGIKDTKIYISSHAHDSIEDYGTPIPNSYKIFDGTIAEHVASDVEDPQTLTLIEPPVTAVSVPPFPPLRAMMSASVWDSQAWLAFVKSDRAKAEKLYFCKITGSADGLPDITVPISSFTSRRRTGTSYLQVVVPGTNQYEEIAARLNGDLIISMAYKLNGAIQFQEEIARVGIGVPDIYEGGRSKTVTLSGTKQTSFTSGKPVALDNVTLSSFISGKRRVRLAVPDLYLNPGDTATVDGYSFTVELITTTVSIMGSGRVTSSMEVAG